jgi:hypothetical protein
MQPTSNDLRTVEVTVTSVRTTLTMYARTNWYGPGNVKHHVETRVVRATVECPPSNDELLKYAQAMARWCTEPRTRAFRPPRTLVWREVATGLDPVSEHGVERDGRDFVQDPLPLEGGSTTPASTTTVPLAPKGQGERAAQRRPSTARDPMIRKMGAGRKFPVDGS